MSKKAQDNLDPEERQALESRSADHSIVISKADKGEAVVIQNVSDYQEKVAGLLNEDGKFNRLECDDTMSREFKLACKLRYLHRLGIFDDLTYKRIVPCGSKAGIMYGLPKIHKLGTPYALLFLQLVLTHTICQST